MQNPIESLLFRSQLNFLSEIYHQIVKIDFIVLAIIQRFIQLPIKHFSLYSHFDRKTKMNRWNKRCSIMNIFPLILLMRFPSAIVSFFRIYFHSYYDSRLLTVATQRSMRENSTICFNALSSAVSDDDSGRIQVHVKSLRKEIHQMFHSMENVFTNIRENSPKEI